jgi:hypothetical protein
MEPIHRDTARENNPLDVYLAGCLAYMDRAIDIDLVVSRERPNIVAMFRCQVDQNRRSSHNVPKSVYLRHIARIEKLWVLAALPNISDPNGDISL